MVARAHPEEAGTNYAEHQLTDGNYIKENLYGKLGVMEPIQHVEGASREQLAGILTPTELELIFPEGNH